MTRFDVPAEVAAVFREFRTTELTTVGKDGTPATWPITAVYHPDSGEFLAATSIGLSQKAANIDRNPRVSLLFSEPRASKLPHPPAGLRYGCVWANEDVSAVAVWLHPESGPMSMPGCSGRACGGCRSRSVLAD